MTKELKELNEKAKRAADEMNRREKFILAHYVKSEEGPNKRIDAIFVLQRFILESEESISKIENEALREIKIGKLKELYYIHDAWSEIVAADMFIRRKNEILLKRVIELESTLIELAAENKRLKELNEF